VGPEGPTPLIWWFLLPNVEAIADPDHPNHSDAKEWADEYDPHVITSC
jgi:hypothetical protein